MTRFFRLDLLSSEGYLASDTLTLRFQVRPPTFYQRCRDQQWYIHQLQALQSQYAAQISDLKERLACQMSSSAAQSPTVPLPGPVSDRPGSASPKPASGHPLPRLKSSRRGGAKLEVGKCGRLFAGTGGELECGTLTSSSESEEEGESEEGEMGGEEELHSGGEAENDVDDETMSGDNDVEYCHSLNQAQSLGLSDMDSLTEPSLDSLGGAGAKPGLSLECMGKTAPGDVSRVGGGVSTALEDEMMLLRLFDLHGRGGSGKKQTMNAVDGACPKPAQTPPTPRPSPAPGRPNPIVTATSIMDTLHMEMVTAGLTAATPAGGSGRPPIAPRPSLGRLDSGGAKEEVGRLILINSNRF